MQEDFRNLSDQDLEKQIQELNDMAEALYPKLIDEIAILTKRTEEKIRSDIDSIVNSRSYARKSKYYVAEIIASFLRM